MTKLNDVSYVYWISSTSQGGFSPDPAWKQKMEQGGIVCPHCGWICPSRIEEINHVTVENNRPPKTHVGSIGDLIYSEVFSSGVELRGRESF